MSLLNIRQRIVNERRQANAAFAHRVRLEIVRCLRENPHATRETLVRFFITDEHPRNLKDAVSELAKEKISVVFGADTFYCGCCSEMVYVSWPKGAFTDEIPRGNELSFTTKKK